MVERPERLNAACGQAARGFRPTRVHVTCLSTFTPLFIDAVINKRPQKLTACRNGGMCMHDEATTHYIDMIDQTTLGHRFIKDEFNVTPRIGWQIDPFGHSAVQAYLLGAEVSSLLQIHSLLTMTSLLICYQV